MQSDAGVQLAQQIRELIQSEGLRPGDRVGREVDLAERFGVSRPTLREALRVLSSAYLIRASKGPGGGIFVSSTPDIGMGRNVSDAVAAMLATESLDLGEVLETRMLLEIPLAGLAASRATPAHVGELRRLVDELAACVDDPAAFGKADIEIHRAVARAAGNRLASSLTAWIAEVLLPVVTERVAPALVEAVIVDQQRRLADAVGAGDGDAAEQAMRDHLTYTLDLVSAVDHTFSSPT